MDGWIEGWMGGLREGWLKDEWMCFVFSCTFRVRWCWFIGGGCAVVVQWLAGGQVTGCLLCMAGAKEKHRCTLFDI